MNAIPHIIVQLVHIEGPLKGEIQDFSIPEILVGRHPDCQVQFPRDVVTLSRKHAKIVREGNRFKLVDTSTNGTFVNGQRVPEAYLKDGDVITFSEGGPKVSFLTQVSDQPAPVYQAPPMEQPPAVSEAPPAAPAAAPSAPMDAAPAYTPPEPTPGAAHQAPAHAAASPSAPAQPPPQMQPAPAASPPQPTPVPQAIKVPFAIQYGPVLKSFQSLPIVLGRGGNCDFVVNHPALNDQQAQIFFSQDQYWIKDLTGTSAVQVNAMPISGQVVLQPEAQVALSPQGPRFRFLSGGRLVELEDQQPQTPVQMPSSSDRTPAESSEHPNKPETKEKKSGGLFKKFFSS